MSKNKLIFAFLIVCVITTYVYLFDVKALTNVDMINHFLGGVLLAALIPEKFKKKPLYVFLLASIVFLGWEALEIFFTATGFYPKLFDETIANRAQDVILDYLGLAIFYR